MDNLKKQLQNGSKTVTLSAKQIDYLNRIHVRAQTILNQLQETMAAEYLAMLAVTEFGMDPNKDFNFNFHPEKEYDNLTITEKIVGKR